MHESEPDRHLIETSPATAPRPAGAHRRPLSCRRTQEGEDVVHPLQRGRHLAETLTDQLTAQHAA